MAGAFVGGGGANSGKVGRNFVVQKKEGGAPAGTITSEGKRGRTEAEIAEAKVSHFWLCIALNHIAIAKLHGKCQPTGRRRQAAAQRH